MAKRPIFIVKDKYPFYTEKMIDFKYYTGFAASQKQKSIISLHNTYKEQGGGNVLEISTKSMEKLGVNLSAFNLSSCIDGNDYKLECIFQGSKVFENGGPYIDLYNVEPWKAKKDVRLRESGNVIGFNLFGKEFKNEPKDFFYNWIYINALAKNKQYLSALEKYEAFSDIEFNPQKSINCQAKAVAISVGLKKAGILDKCLLDEKLFLSEVYSIKVKEIYEQITFFNKVY